MPKITVLSGAAIIRPQDPTKTGYAFDDWYEDAACTILFSFETLITGNKTLYAGWIQKLTGPNYNISSKKVVLDFSGIIPTTTIVNQIVTIPSTTTVVKVDGTVRRVSGKKPASIRSSAATGLSFLVAPRSTTLTICFENINITGNASQNLIEASGKDVNLEFVGDLNSLTSVAPYSVINCRKLSITGYAVMSGGNAVSYGQKGADAVKCEQLIVVDSELIVAGGHGYAGQAGTAGGNTNENKNGNLGGNGGAGGHALSLTGIITLIRSTVDLTGGNGASGGNGGAGGDNPDNQDAARGGNGGNGGAGGHAIASNISSFQCDSQSFMYLRGGNGGKGGNGGRGGDGNTEWWQWGSQRDGGSGGNGGNGGAGGNTINSTFRYHQAVIATIGIGGNGGTGGAGGTHQGLGSDGAAGSPGINGDSGN